MTEQEKQILLVDLCARLPYRVKCKASHGLSNTDKKHEYIGVLKFIGNCYGVIANYYEDVPHDTGLINNVFYDIEYIKPYLRPMSSMTEEEKSTYLSHCECDDGDYTGEIIYFNTIESFDYLNQIHIDYRNLIPRGIAIEAPEGMYTETRTCNNCESKDCCSQSEYVKTHCYKLQ